MIIVFMLLILHISEAEIILLVPLCNLSCWLLPCNTHSVVVQNFSILQLTSFHQKILLHRV